MRFNKAQIDSYRLSWDISRFVFVFFFFSIFANIISTDHANADWASMKSACVVLNVWDLYRITGRLFNGVCFEYKYHIPLYTILKMQTNPIVNNIKNLDFRLFPGI